MNKNKKIISEQHGEGPNDSDAYEKRQPRTDANTVLRTFKHLVEQRDPLNQYWRDAFKFTLPYRGTQFSTNSTDPVSNTSTGVTDNAKLYDSTGSEAVKLLAASIVSGLTPSAAQWFQFKINNVNQSQLPHHIRTWIENASKILFNEIHNNSNYNAVILEAMEELAITGQFGLYITKAESDPGEPPGKFKFEFWPTYSMYIQENPESGLPDTVYRRIDMTAQEAEENFGYDALPYAIKAVLDNPGSNSETKRFPFVHCIQPRDDYRPESKLQKDMHYASIYVCETSKTVVKESGFNELPVIIPRWSRYNSTPYALGPVQIALPDLKTLNKIVEMQLQNAEMAIAGTYVAQADGYLNPNTIKIGARKVIFAANVQNVKALTSGGDFRIAVEEIARLQKQIKGVMMADDLEPIAKNYASATEVATRTQIVRQILAPIFNRLNSEFLEGFLNRCFQLALRDGTIPAPPQELDGLTLSPVYVSSMSRAQRVEEVQAMIQFEQQLGAIAQLNNSVLDLYDFDLAVSKKAELLGVPTDLIRSIETVKKIREDNAQAQAQAQQEQAAQSLLTNPQALKLGMEAAGGPDAAREMIQNQMAGGQPQQ